MLFHAFSDVYTVKELDYHAKHGQHFTIWMYNRVFLCWTSHFRFRTSFGELFSIVALADINDGGTPYMGISPGRTRPCTHWPEREQKQPISTLHSAALYGTRSGRMSLKKCVFGCEGKITLLSFPKSPALRKPWMQFVFLGQQRSFLSVFVDCVL